MIDVTVALPTFGSWRAQIEQWLAGDDGTCVFARRSVVADERDEARIYISEPLSHLCSMYYVRVRWGSAARFQPKATVGWR